MEDDWLRTCHHPEDVVDIVSPGRPRSCTDFVYALADQDELSETRMGRSILNPGIGDEHSQEIRGSI